MSTVVSNILDGTLGFLLSVVGRVFLAFDGDLGNRAAENRVTNIIRNCHPSVFVNIVEILLHNIFSTRGSEIITKKCVMTSKKIIAKKKQFI